MRANMTKAAGAAASLVLVLGLGACSDDGDDGDGATDTTAAGGGADEFCGALVEFNGSVMNVEIDETSTQEDIIAAGEQLAPLMTTISENAPEAVAANAGELNDAVQGLLGGDATAFNDDATFETYTEFVAQSIDACPFEQIEVTMVDYGYEGLPETIEAGTVAFVLTNASEAEPHEMALMRKADGVELSVEELLALPEDEAETMIEFVGAGFAPPGAQGATLVDLTPGDYAVVCFIPVGGGEDGPPHFTEGMSAEFTVD